jgi:hypothetical protein
VVYSYFRKALLFTICTCWIWSQLKCAELKLYSTYRLVNVVCWKRAICLEFIGKVSIPDTKQTKGFNFLRSSSVVTYADETLQLLVFSTYNMMIVLAMQADVLEYYDQTVSSPSGSFYIPVGFSQLGYCWSGIVFSLCCSGVVQVPQLLQVVKRRRVKQSLSRKNILYMDEFTCQ